MPLLFDQNISYRLISKLQDSFFNCKHVSDVGLNNADDIQIWEFAKKGNFVIVTFDSDYFDMSLIYGTPPKIVWLRTGNITTDEIRKIFISNALVINDFVLNPDHKDKSCLEIGV
jgi:predicted nuclease of predicted toxin-antitoxin system